MNKYRILKYVLLAAGATLCLCFGLDVLAEGYKAGGSGIGSVAAQAKKSLTDVAMLITAGSYVAGMGFAVGAVAKFKAHKDNPTQIPISTPIALLFVAAALIFIPSVFKTTGGTLFGSSGMAAGTSGITRF